MSERRMDVSGFVSVYVQKERRVVWTGREVLCVFMHVERLGCKCEGRNNRGTSISGETEVEIWMQKWGCVSEEKVSVLVEDVGGYVCVWSLRHSVGLSMCRERLDYTHVCVCVENWRCLCV